MSDETVTVFQYGARRQPTGKDGRTGRPAAAYPDLIDEAMEQVRLAHQMRNHLVEVERCYDDAVRWVWARYPQVAEVDAQLEALTGRKDELLARLKTQQQQQRSRERVDPQLRAEIADVRAQIRVAKTARREVRDVVYPQARQALQEVADARGELRKAIRQWYAYLGLYWGTYNAVAAHHQTADKVLRQKRKQGLPAQHNFRRFDGGGTLAVQLQRQAGDPPRTPEVLADPGGKWSGQVQITPWIPPQTWAAMSRAERRLAGRGEVRMRVTSRDHGEHVVDIPVQVHRMLPADADVTGVQLTRRTAAGTPTLSVAVTAKVPTVPVRDEGSVVAVHVGWRVRGDGSLRVATVVSTGDLVVPDRLADVVVSHGGWAEVILPAKWRGEYERYEKIRSGRDKDLDRIKERLAGWLDEHGPLEVDGWRAPVTGANVRMWRSAERVIKLAEALYGTGHDLDAELWAWRRQDLHLWRWEAGGRQRLTARRDDAWRNVAAWLARSHRLVVTDDVDIADLARSRESDDRQVEAARANRVVAAPGRLRELVRAAAPNHGAGAVIAAAAGGNAHYRCGTVTAVPEEYASNTTVWCGTCGRGYDQDRNMCLMLLAASGEVSPPPGVAARGGETAGGGG